MKLTEEYYQDALKIVKLELDRGNPSGVIWILEQIALDARREALEDAKGAVKLTLDANGSPSVGVAIMKAISSLEVK
jgi:hypothetical protein